MYLSFRGYIEIYKLLMPYASEIDACRGHKYQMAKTHKTYSLRDSCIITDKFPYLTKMRICHIKE